MRHTSIRISESFVLPAGQRAALAKASQVYGAVEVSPDEMGGFFDFIDWKGNPVRQDYFLGRWTLLYFGYSRCSGSCRAAAPMIAQAADVLRARGFAARAAFVDIESQHISGPRMIAQRDRAHLHGSNWPMRFAMAKVYDDNAGKLDVLTGNRAQIAAATAAFHVLREHIPPRPEESGMSIKHSSMIYLIGPETFVSAYAYHDVGADGLVSLVERLANAQRKPVDFAAAKQRYLRGACGGDI